jgi:hypothetical protein
MADEKYSKKKFGDTYYPITQNQMSNNRFKNFTGDKKFGSREDLNKYHKDLKTKLSKEKVRPSEILKLDKEFKSRMKRANDDLQYKLSNRAGMKEERKKQKGTIPDTGSAFSTGGQMLKGGQKKLDKNKDGKISGDDFKMMKAKYGKMMKAGKGGGADIDYRLGTKMQGDYEGKTLTGKAKEFLGTGVKQTKGSISELRKKLLKKLRGAQVGPAEEAALDKMKPSEMKKKLDSMSKAKYGKMMKANKGMEAKSTKGYGAARTSGMGLQDQSLKSGQNYEITKGGDYIKDLI